MTKRWQWVVLLQCFLILTSAIAVSAQDEIENRYFTLKDTAGKIVCRTAHRVVVGDRYLNGQNQLYEVIRVTNTLARVKRVNHKSEGLFSQVKATVLDFLAAQSVSKTRGPIAIFHTHNDEAYQPTEGVSSKQMGGIIQVGDALTDAFEKKGIPVVHSKTSHSPHDSSAYDRSRRTCAQLLKQRPAVLLDVHRDAVPKSEYATTINQQPVTKIQFVVGRQNPNFQACNDFAKRVMQECNRKSPGLIKGIFYGKGKYNQDIGSRTMLMECGSNTNRREEAIRSTKIFANAAASVLYGQTATRQVNQGSWRNMIIVLTALAIGIGLFFLLNRRGLGSLLGEFTGNKDKDKR